MNKLRSISFLFIVLMVIHNSNAQLLIKRVDSIVLPDSLKYLAQIPPGNIPSIFAPGIVSLTGRNETVITFSPDGKTIFFSIGNWPNRQIMIIEYKNGAWTSPTVAPFSATRSADEPSFSLDGNRVYYYAYNAPNSVGGSDICFSEKHDTLWSSPVNLGSPLNSSSDEYHPCAVADSSLYFISSSGKVCRSQYTNGVYESRVTLPTIINDGLPASYLDPYVAPDESYLIFNSRRSGGYGGYDLYVSYKITGGSWTNPINLGKTINTSADDMDGDITPDGKYMTFTRNGSDIYWVSARIIDSIKQTITTVKKETRDRPGDYNLSQNFPNPFNPSTNISFHIPSRTFVSLKIYDILGREVVDLVSAEIESGDHFVKWDASRMANGIYYCRLQSGSFMETKKLLLLK